MTPEGRIKKKLKDLLDSYGKALYYYMPVPSGYGKSTIDYLGCARGRFFGIEAKGRPDQGPTVRQEGVIEDILAAGGVVFVVNDDVSLAHFQVWLDVVCA
jgi:hypothetical protein